jgi:hypothetical protein
VQVMAQSERLCRLAAERRALVEAAPAADVSGALAGMQDRGAALSAAILDAEARITSVLRQKRDGQSNRGAHILSAVPAPKSQPKNRPGGDSSLPRFTAHCLYKPCIVTDEAQRG